MDLEIDDPPEFAWTWPLWVVIDEAKIWRAGLCNALLFWPGEEGENASLLVFTDSDLAQRFVRRVGWCMRWRALEIDRPGVFGGLLHDLLDIGLDQLAVDLRPDDRRFVIPIVDVLSLMGEQT